MTLKDYWRRRGGTLRDLADHLGLPVTQPLRTVQRYVEHERRPGVGLMQQIADKTDGQVGLADWPGEPVRSTKRERTAQPVAA